MKIHKAVITAAGRNQRTLPLQTLIDRDGTEKAVLRIVLDEVQGANVDEVCVVVSPGDEVAYGRAANDRNIRFIQQEEPLGYGHALACAREFVANEPFLHLVGDHLYVGANGDRCAHRLVAVAEGASCSVSAVQATRETLIGRYGVIGGQRIAGQQDLYRVETVIEKPTPTEAEQSLIVSGLRSGYYLCFFGMHVLTPSVFELMKHQRAALGKEPSLSSVLAELARREQYLAMEQVSQRYDVGVRYGIFQAQLALALNGRDRNEVLAQMLELVALNTAQTRSSGQDA